MKLVLGTAQFGMPYGVTNDSGQPSTAEVSDILNLASAQKINLLDTAKAYGSSEQLLGTILKGSNKFQLITKVPKLDLAEGQDELIEQIHLHVRDSMHQLCTKQLYAIFLHCAEDLLSEQGEIVYQALYQLKSKGKVQKIGVSAYSPNEVDAVIKRYPIDIVQIPCNLVDQRALASGLLARLKSDGVEVHVRSAFLQGVLLSEIATLPSRFSVLEKQLTALDELSKVFKVSKMAIALDFLKQNAAVDHIVIGVLNHQQLKECFAAYEQQIPGFIDYQSFTCANINLIDPRRWQ